MRPSPDELLVSLRHSLSDTIMPKVEDRWARYVGTAMDLVLQHLQRRVAGEHSSLAEDNADMAVVLADLTTRAAGLGAKAEGSDADRWAALAEIVQVPGSSPDADGSTDLAALTARNEELRAMVVAVMRWLDDAENHEPSSEVEQMRDDVYRLIRRQTDRNTALVEPLFMSFGPAAS